MNQISTVKGLSVNTVKNEQLKRRYEKHIDKIIEISQKKPNVKHMFDQQRKISDILKKSKQVSKSFKEKQFMIKCEIQNNRLLKSLSTINTRAKLRTERNEEGNNSRRRMKTFCKEGALRQYEIERENRKLAHNIMENVCDVNKYRKKIEKQISEYERLKLQLQRLKPFHLEKISFKLQSSSSSTKFKAKNLQSVETEHQSLTSQTVKLQNIKQ